MWRRSAVGAARPVWQYQEFSLWLSDVFHHTAAEHGDPFLARIAEARMRRLLRSPAAAAAFAAIYIGQHVLARGATTPRSPRDAPLRCPPRSPPTHRRGPRRRTAEVPADAPPRSPPTHRPLAGHKARLAGPVTIASP